jgi:MoaA/NifB/PqqE/SkfB family radical SAM enzyme
MNTATITKYEPPDLDETIQATEPFTPANNANRNRIFSGYLKRWIELKIWLTAVKILLQQFRSPRQIIEIGNSLEHVRQSFQGGRVQKIVKAGNRYFWDLYVPGWPSNAYSQFIKGEVNRISAIKGKSNRLTNAFVAITKKCSLQCEHCFEWDSLNQKEALSVDDIRKIVSRFEDVGVSQIQFTGGEPMLRINDLIDVLASAGKETDFWLLTSGLNLTRDNARRLKTAGLTGVVISMDHYDHEANNKFRGFKHASTWAEQAVANANAVGLVTALSLCPSRDFVNEKNLHEYMDHARRLGVGFVQVLEPKAVGHYRGKDVLLTSEQEKILDRFFLAINYDKFFKDFPLVSYHGYYQRRIGCFASGNRNVYVDTDGDYHACPYCQEKCGSAIDGNMIEALDSIQNKGCHTYRNARI